MSHDIFANLEKYYIHTRDLWWQSTRLTRVGDNMEFSGTFELEDTTVEEVWLALSDPVLIEQSLPGCQFLVNVDDTDVDFEELQEMALDREVELTGDPEVIVDRAFEEGGFYAALMQVSVGPVNPAFETVVTIDHREFPEMSASGDGSSSDSSFEVSSWMALSKTENGVGVEWEVEADVFGKIAQMGQRVVNPVANRLVKRFFSSVQERLHDLTLEETATSGVSDAANADENRDPGFVERMLGRNDSDSER